MFGPMYSQMMKSRLGVGKPLEGYGGFGPPQGASANGGFSQQGGVTPPPTPWGPQDGASLPAPSPWLHQKDNMGGATLPHPTPWEPSGGASLPGPTPWSPAGGASLPQESPMSPQKFYGGAAGGGMKNPWQRY